MHLGRLVARALKVLPALVIAVAAVFQVHASGERARALPTPPRLTLLARADVRALRDPHRGRALESAGTRTKRDLDRRDLVSRAFR